MYDLVPRMQDFLPCFFSKKYYSQNIYFLIPKPMNKIDRIFIAALVVIVCLSGIYAVKSFSKGREAINVVGEGKVEIPANKITMTVNFIFSGDHNQTIEKQKEAIKKLEETIAPLGFSISNKRARFQESNKYGHWCYTNEEHLAAPCLDSYITITSSGENIIENWEKLITHFKEQPYQRVELTELSIENWDAAVQEARILALQDARQLALTTAHTLEVDLGRLLQTTEYALESDMYYDDGQTYVFKQTFHNEESIANAQNITIVRKAYLTYDID